MESAPPAVKASVAPAHGMMKSNMPSRTGVAPSGGGGQWDRFELKLSKPSGKQKLGMVLKHAVNEVSQPCLACTTVCTAIFRYAEPAGLTIIKNERVDWSFSFGLSTFILFLRFRIVDRMDSTVLYQ